MTNYLLIENCIDDVESRTNKVYTDYAELAEKIEELLHVDITEDDILDYYENYYCCEQEDLKVQSRYLHLL